MRNRFRNDLAANKSPRSNGTVGRLVTTWLDQHSADPQTVDDYRFLADTFIIPALGRVRLTTLTRPGPSPIEKFYTELRRCRRRCNRKPYTEHRKNCPSATDPDYRCDKRCKPHECKPLGGSTLRHIHVVLNGSFKAAIRWGMIGVNPLDAVIKPTAPPPQPNPPAAANAARIIQRAWTEEPEWGTFVWLTMVTGARRGELVALRFRNVQLSCKPCERPVTWDDDKCPVCDGDLAELRTADLELRRSYSARKRQEKDTKSH